MPNFNEMKSLLLRKMRRGTGESLTTDFNGNKITLDKDPCFLDYANMGATLSTPASRPAIRTALQGLEEDMLNQIGGFWWRSDKKTSAVEHFNQKRTAFDDKTGRPPSDGNFSKLLTRSLDAFEKAHGFVVPEKLPIFAGFVYGGVFKDTIKNRMHFKDVGAGSKHGEFTHRIQWYALVKAGALVSVDKNEAGLVYGSIHRWLNKSAGEGLPLLQLWNYLFDMQKSLLGEGEALDDDDFRSPENFNTWLTGDAEPDFCPLLRSFLRMRMSKRQDYSVEAYFKKKLGAVAGAQAFDAWQVGFAKKENPSARIVYDERRVGAYVPKVV